MKNYIKLTALLVSFATIAAAETMSPEINTLIMRMKLSHMPAHYPIRTAILYGPSANKATVAATIATKAGYQFKSVDSSKVCTEYLGQGGENVHKIFTEANASYEKTGKRVALFFNNVEKICCDQDRRITDLLLRSELNKHKRQSCSAFQS